MIVFINKSYQGPFDHGYANGYVAVPKDHPYYGKHYDDIEDIDIHGGLTFSENGKWCYNNYEDLEIIEGNKEDLKDCWVFGFDTCHWMDDLGSWPKERVIKETLRLKEQLENV